MNKLRNTEAELKKSVAYKKTCSSYGLRNFYGTEKARCIFSSYEILLS